MSYYRPYTPDTWPEPRSGTVFLEELKAAQMKRRKFTVEEFYRMVPACILGEDTLEELIEGDVMVRALKTPRHSGAISRLFRLFISEDSSGLNPSVQCPIRCGHYNEPVADMALLSPDFEGKEHPGAEDVLLAIEVADTPEEVKYDQNIKRPLYARYGIPELWLVRLQSGIVEAHRQTTPEGYADVRPYGRGDTLTIQALPGTTFSVDDLLR